jgi:hypothetical protein
MTSIVPTTAQRLPFVAPTCGRTRGELRPQDSFVDSFLGSFAPRVQDDVLAAGGAGTAAGYPAWSPPIT